MQYPDDHKWTRNDHIRFAEMWADGVPTAKIGLEFGVSKNAVVGVRTRLDLPARPSPVGQSFPTVLHVDWNFVHDGRKAGECWELLSDKVNHPRDALRKWYDAQCISRGVDPVRLRKKGLRPIVRRAIDERPAIDFEDVHQSRMNGVLWSVIARKYQRSESSAKQWYFTECRRNGIEMALPPQHRARVSHFTFRKEAPVEAPPIPAPISGGVLYEFMPRGCCHWPLNDARPWRMCGDPAGRNVYCGDHTIDADQKKQAERRRRLECSRVVMVGEVAA